MGKRSDFPRRKNDMYDTPREAVTPLIAHLPISVQGVRFWEPCAGKGDLADGLEAAWPCGVCTLKTDIAPRREDIVERDALDCYPAPFELIITNPPWTRQILHPMIEHFSAMRPTWLLFDADWMHTKQAEPYLEWCRKIVSVGRVKWIPDSPHTGKDNCAWYLFDQRATGDPVFCGRTTCASA